MKKLIQLLVVLCIFVLIGCKTNKERYLSITTSGYDKKGNEVMNIYEYSLSTKKVTKKYTSSNPLGVYSKSNNAVYYAEEDNGSDHLYAYDLDTKKSKKLSGGLTAINQIIPVENNIYVLGVEKGERSLKPYRYNIETQKFSMVKAKDGLDFDRMVYDVFNHDLYLCASNQKEEDQALEDANAGKGSKYIAPNTHIYRLKNNQLKRIYTTNRQLVYRMLPMESGNLMFTESDTIPAWNPQYHTYTLDKKTNKKKAGINIDEIMDVTQYASFSSSKQIILLGTKDEHQGIYTYDIDSGKTELLYESKNELINSFELLE
ncbi:hypothetical protein [uncultured Catenibacterium sp.]|uniref:hypothetical protein n=1 Tax=uncultured Catenibacterium sp. TaxID=286142 RepID=UPI0025E0359B|nr:hypothetical protein [uncultured Catenibacterium sp.]